MKIDRELDSAQKVSIAIDALKAAGIAPEDVGSAERPPASI
jgi:hypothetical protein